MVEILLRHSGPILSRLCSRYQQMFRLYFSTDVEASSPCFHISRFFPMSQFLSLLCLFFFFEIFLLPATGAMSKNSN